MSTHRPCRRSPRAPWARALGRLATTTLLAVLALAPLAGARAEPALGQNEYAVFHHHDALGTRVAATDARGDVLWYEYVEPYEGVTTLLPLSVTRLPP